MARTRTKENVAEEWSCPLCTLLNTPKDDRCAACNNARPPVDQLRKAQPSERSTANATTSEVQHIYRPASGVFFSSLPIIQSDSGAVNTWKQEPRLAVNRQRGIRRRNAVINVNTRVSGEQVEKSFDGRTTGSTVVDAAKKEDAKVIAQVPSATVTVGLREQAEEKQEEDEEDTGIEEPSFNLLGFGASVFVAQPVPDAVEDQCAANETKNREKSEELCSSDDDMEVLSPPPKYPGFMPASKVLVEETKIEEKLASAGLDLSDSEDEDEPKMLRRRSEDKDNSWEDKWVCQICRNLNDQTALECSICKCNRYRSPVESMEAPLEPVAKSDLQWACHICTNLNPPEASDCLMCLSTRKNDKTTGRRWKCSVCATFNESGAVRCELCDSSRAKSPKKTPGKQGLQCSVCTNINPPGKNRCELCDSSLLGTF
ncbi:hypothetical protein DVH05_027718 [Phytophthora capsici]|nr:hypothetical protein DVH05_027718 [Phytophthora capsici]